VQAGFAKLRAHFLAGLPQRWAEIENAATPELRRAALHKLCGAAGSYGYTELGAAARRAEAACAAGAPGAKYEALDTALVQLRGALLQAGVTVP
jgi:HPt (histidine-containing phosphotransfer) domain-containing protein